MKGISLLSGGSILALAVTMAGCSGGAAPSLPTVKLDPPDLGFTACTAVAGPADPVQQQLVQNLDPALAQVPELGSTLVSLSAASAAAFDTFDAVANSLVTLASTQDPQQFADDLSSSGDTLQCYLANIVAAVDGANTLAQGTPLENAPVISDIYAQALAISELLQANPAGVIGAPSSASGQELAILTDQLSALSDSLSALGTDFSRQFPDQPIFASYLTVPAVMASNLADVFDGVGSLDANATSRAIRNTLSNSASTIAIVGGAVQLGLPLETLVPAGTQIGTLLLQFEDGLNLLLEPTFGALSTVLAASPALPANGFADLVSGALAGSPQLGEFGDLLSGFSGGGLDPTGAPIPALSDLLAGIPQFGSLAQTVFPNQLPSDPADAVAALLSGAPGVPTFGELMDRLTNLANLVELSPDQASALVNSLLALGENGVPLIINLIGNAPNTAGNLPNLATSLLGVLTGLPGGIG